MNFRLMRMGVYLNLSPCVQRVCIERELQYFTMMVDIQQNSDGMHFDHMNSYARKQNHSSSMNDEQASFSTNEVQDG